MKPVNIYALTRITDPERLAKLDRQLSQRSRFLKIKEWEIEGLKAFTDNIAPFLTNGPELSFFYSFTMPKLGKEFDLLRVGEKSVINIELKSGNVSDEVIRDQLLQNRYYLSTLGLDMHFYTYISNYDRLVRLSNSLKLVETDFEDLAEVMCEQGDCYKGDIEELFKEEDYLISPLTDPGRFLRQEYFLTSQQKDIERQILKLLKKEENAPSPVYCGFTGLPGTGKTILLYDLAMRLSKCDKVCVLHFGTHLKGLEELDDRLKRIDFFYCEDNKSIEVTGDYKVILVDEGHRINTALLDEIIAISGRMCAPVIFSYDKEDAIAQGERAGYGAEIIEALPGFTGFKLTNRIRLNAELSSFINCLMSFLKRSPRHDYPSVKVAYAANDEEAADLIAIMEKDGFIYLRDNNIDNGSLLGPGADKEKSFEIDAVEATCKEFDKVVMLMDSSFCYDEEGNLRNASALKADAFLSGDIDDFKVRKLFHGLSRAKRKVALVIKENESVLDVVLFILQGKVR